VDWRLTDDPPNRKWVFPNAKRINRQARLFIFCDGPSQTRGSGLHASIGLKDNGETL